MRYYYSGGAKKIFRVLSLVLLIMLVGCSTETGVGQPTNTKEKGKTTETTAVTKPNTTPEKTKSNTTPEKPKRATREFTVRVTSQPLDGVPFSIRMNSANAGTKRDEGVTPAYFQLVARPGPIGIDTLSAVAKADPQDSILVVSIIDSNGKIVAQDYPNRPPSRTKTEAKQDPKQPGEVRAIYTYGE